MFAIGGAKLESIWSSQGARWHEAALATHAKGDLFSTRRLLRLYLPPTNRSDSSSSSGVSPVSLQRRRAPSAAPKKPPLRGTQSTNSPLPTGLQVPFAVRDNPTSAGPWTKGAVLCLSLKPQATQHFRHPTDPDLELKLLVLLGPSLDSFSSCTNSHRSNSSRRPADAHPTSR